MENAGGLDVGNFRQLLRIPILTVVLCAIVTAAISHGAWWLLVAQAPAPAWLQVAVGTVVLWAGVCFATRTIDVAMHRGRAQVNAATVRNVLQQELPP